MQEAQEEEVDPEEDDFLLAADCLQGKAKNLSELVGRMVG